MGYKLVNDHTVSLDDGVDIVDYGSIPDRGRPSLVRALGEQDPWDGTVPERAPSSE